MVILVDTDVIIDYLCSIDKKATTFHKLFINSNNEAIISFVTKIELLAGMDSDDPDKKNIIEKLLESVEILESNESFCEVAGEILRHYSISFQDALIASHSIVASLPLLTRNKKDFAKIAGVRLYEKLQRHNNR